MYFFDICYTSGRYFSFFWVSMKQIICICITLLYVIGIFWDIAPARIMSLHGNHISPVVHKISHEMMVMVPSDCCEIQMPVLDPCISDCCIQSSEQASFQYFQSTRTLEKKWFFAYIDTYYYFSGLTGNRYDISTWATISQNPENLRWLTYASLISIIQSHT